MRKKHGINRYIPEMAIFFCLITLLLVSAGASALEIELSASEAHGFDRRSEAVRTGIPLPRGEVADVSALALLDRQGQPVPAQFEALTAWPDGSARWVLVDFQADCPAGAKAAYTLTDRASAAGAGSPLTVRESSGAVVVETGVMRCELSTESFDLFGRVWLDHDGDGSFSDSELVSVPGSDAAVRLTDDRGREMSSRRGEVESIEVEARGPVRATVAVKGTMGDIDGEAWLHYTARLHFYAGTGLVRVFYTLENYHAMVPAPGAHWVLGQPGSRFFEDMSLLSRLDFEGPIQMSVGDGSRELLDRVVVTDRGGIYQESSGGENWFHRNHMIHDLSIPLTFRGATTFLGDSEPYQVDRPDAWLHTADRQFGLAVAVRHFWQNFPKALTADRDGTVRVALWPAEWPAAHELQGGEIKTHEVAFFFHTGPQGSGRNENRVATVMGSFHHPLVFRAAPGVYLANGSFDDFATYDPRRFPVYERYQQAAVAGDTPPLVEDIETIDEYGWRNFGDTWAKNETDKTTGPHTGRNVVSHFNLEYDFGYGMLFQSIRTLQGAPELSGRWWELAEAALRHESDIDVYHALPELGAREIFSGAKYTHTQHGVEAGLATHRGGARDHWFGDLEWPWGRGGSPESGHFNTRGQITYYLMTGNRRVLESAMQQTDCVLYKITNDRFAQIDRLSREAGNNLQIMADAYLLTRDDKYRQAAEKILASTAPETQWYMSEQGRSSHPDDNVAGFWTSAICINAAARFTEIMEEDSGAPYTTGRDYVTAYADFLSTYLAAGPEAGFHSSWSPAGGGNGHGYGPWTYRLTDVAMFGHKFTSDNSLRSRCLKAARGAFDYMERQARGMDSLFSTGKNTTMIIGGGHEYTFYRQNGGWK